jgi:hypothetical protein
MYDRDSGRLDIISANSEGRSANGFSLRPMIAPDQTFVAFVSYTADLVPNDYNESPDIFAAYFPVPDSDNDQIDDRWEVSNFGSLDHDMALDTDRDAATDAQEFEAGTDPNSATSQLRLTTTQLEPNGALNIRWNASPGRAYRIQASARLDGGAWQDLTDAVIANQPNESITVPLSNFGPELYLRIVLAD